jgi:hypothetical protein
MKCKKAENNENRMKILEFVQKKLAGTTGLEPATFGVTGRRSNQLSYVPNSERHYITSFLDNQVLFSIF